MLYQESESFSSLVIFDKASGWLAGWPASCIGSLSSTHGTIYHSLSIVTAVEAIRTLTLQGSEKRQVIHGLAFRGGVGGGSLRR